VASDYNMLIDTIITTAADLGKSDTNRLKVAYGVHKNSVVNPGAKAINFETAEGNEKVTITLNQQGLRDAYEDYVKSGKKYGPSLSWPEEQTAASMEYKNSPNLSKARTSTGEIAGGVDNKGSTIVASGLGPNVNVSGDLSSREVVDGSATPSSAILDPHHSGDGSASPHNTSTSIVTENALSPSLLGHAFPKGEG
jgi:hypothetical protein